MITVNDIAKKSGVSGATVSRILNKKENFMVSEATRKRVMKIADELGYRPSGAARALAKGKTDNIGLFVPGEQERFDPHFTGALHGIEQKIRSLGYRMALFSELDSLLAPKTVDGVLAICNPSSYSINAFEGLPHMFVYPMTEAPSNTVGWSDETGMYQAASYLVEQGHTKIAAIMGEAKLSIETMFPKARGILKARDAFKFDLISGEGEYSPDSYENGYLITKKILAESRDFTALVARNDFMARGAIKALREASLKTPEDVSVIGYGNTILAFNADPELTSVHTPFAESGELAAEQLIAVIDNDVQAFDGALLPTKLVIRQSTIGVKQ